LTRWTSEKGQEFLDHLREGVPVRVACRLVNISHGSIYNHKNADPEFSAEWDEAYKLGTETLEQEARRRAVEGWDEPKFHDGVVVGYVRKFDSTLLMFLLKSRDRDRFSDKSDVNMKLDATVNIAEKLERRRRKAGIE
jgi:hypothetical protein